MLLEPQERLARAAQFDDLVEDQADRSLDPSPLGRLPSRILTWAVTISSPRRACLDEPMCSEGKDKECNCATDRPAEATEPAGLIRLAAGELSLLAVGISYSYRSISGFERASGRQVQGRP
jgi:hypothetical protein